MRRAIAVLAVLGLGALGGFFGQSLAADATSGSSVPASAPSTLVGITPVRLQTSTVHRRHAVTITVGGRHGVPAAATAAVVTLTASGAGRATSLTVYPAGSHRPGTTALPVPRHATVSTTLTTQLHGKAFVVYSSSATVSVRVDVSGYYTAVPATVPASAYRTLYAQRDETFTGYAALATAGSTRTLTRIDVTAPSAGTAAVDLDTQLWTDYPGNAAASPLLATVTIAHCSAPATLSGDCVQQTYYTQKPPNTATSSDITMPMSVHATLTFTAAGTKSVYVNGYASGYPGGFYQGAHAQVAFTPSSPAPSGSTVALQLAS